MSTSNPIPPTPSAEQSQKAYERAQEVSNALGVGIEDICVAASPQGGEELYVFVRDESGEFEPLDEARLVDDEEED